MIENLPNIFWRFYFFFFKINTTTISSPLDSILNEQRYFFLNKKGHQQHIRCFFLKKLMKPLEIHFSEEILCLFSSFNLAQHKKKRQHFNEKVSPKEHLSSYLPEYFAPLQSKLDSTAW